MEWKFKCICSLTILCIAVLSESAPTSCSKKEKVAILLNLAKEFLSKATDSHQQCSYSGYPTTPETSLSLMDTAKHLILAAKSEYFTKSQNQNQKYKVVCYFDSWAYSRRGEGKFDMSAFPSNLCTHAIYGLAKLEDNRIVSSQPMRDLPESLKGYQIFNDLKLRNPKLKTLIGIGGWDMGSAPFSSMASDPGKRSVFIDSVVSFLDKHGFDGVDIDWAYPGSNGGKPEDRQNFVVLLKELKAALKPRGRLVTTTVSATAFVVETAYDIPKMSEELDQIHLLSFDFHGSWNNYTGMNAPLYAPAEASVEDKENTVDFAVNYWLEGGVPKEKLILSLPFFGRTYTLANPSGNGVGATATGAGKPGLLNGGDEELGFNEVCENLTKKLWACVWDTDSQTPYAYKENQWVSYDDQKSINAKVDYLIKKGLAGALVRSIDTDDHKGQCYGKKYVLLRSVANKLRL